MKSAGLAIVALVLALAAWAMSRLEWVSSLLPGEALLAPVDRTLAAGGELVLAIDEHGRILGWGTNERGQLGLTGICSVPVPKLIAAAPAWRSVHSGTDASYAIARDGALWRRGFPTGWPTSRSRRTCAGDRVPLPYEPLNWESRWLKVQQSWSLAAGIDSAGTLWFWNDDEIVPEAERDIGGRADAKLVKARPETRWRDFCLAIHKSYAVAVDGTLWTDGVTAGPRDVVRADQFAELVQIPADTQFARVSCRENSAHVMVLDSAGRLWGMGGNRFGELGSGDSDPYTLVTTPTRVAQRRWSDVAVGNGFTIGIDRDGSLFAWGNNAQANLGTGSHDSSDTPRLVDAERRWVAVATGYGFAAGLTSDGAIFTWGSNAYGVLGDGGGARVHTAPARIHGNDLWAVPASGGSSAEPR